ncbi:peptidase M23 [Paenibacillus sp. MY03]|uniref:M23 family metallopeptidase n=1 Tax=Paenibacillus sp. MY03 TaxID=302980 RepID=UPI000B577280|nr:M23 family metallopeptidase [Paenibacillus sp. MY03]OUS71954.1 peptidase M23 [Paenibacillus sp. MY03]
MKAIIPLSALIAAALLQAVPATGAAAAAPVKQTQPSGTAVIQSQAAGAAEEGQLAANLFDQRRELYDQLSNVTGVEWYWIAAVDQYERSMSKAKPKARPLLGQIAGVFVEPERWAGPLNPDSDDSSPASIRFFEGIGKDGDGNGLAERTSDIDLLYSLITFMGAKGTVDMRFPAGVWDYYHNNRAVQRVEQFAAIYKHYGKLDLFEHAFPLPLGTSYSYRDTWGDRRGWGGRRSHEGTDLFAGHGTPVRSTCYGIIEIKGWNKYGGWRIGIRDLNNHYHYYAHLSGFDKKLNVGDIVEAGQVVGWVGSSGYGKPGTSGKFPPHLHYGVYSDRGLLEWAFDPYPMLKRWEQAEWQRRRSGK